MYGPSRMKILAIEEQKMPIFSYSKFNTKSVRAFINNTGLTGHTCPERANPQNSLLSHVAYRV
jgi:hypothetical protein